MDYKAKIGVDRNPFSKLDIAVEYLVRAFMVESEDSLSLDVTLANGKLINIHISYVQESK